MSPLYAPGVVGERDRQVPIGVVRRQQRMVGQDLLRHRRARPRHAERARSTSSTSRRRARTRSSSPATSIRASSAWDRRRCSIPARPRTSTRWLAPASRTVMGFELCPTDGTMWLGGYDDSARRIAGAVHAAPVDRRQRRLLLGRHDGDGDRRHEPRRERGDVRQPDRRHRHEPVLHPELGRDRADQGLNANAALQVAVLGQTAHRPDELEFEHRGLRHRVVLARPTRRSTRCCPSYR